MGLSTEMSLKLMKIRSSRCAAACVSLSTHWVSLRLVRYSWRLVVLGSVWSSRWYLRLTKRMKAVEFSIRRATKSAMVLLKLARGPVGVVD